MGANTEKAITINLVLLITLSGFSFSQVEATKIKANPDLQNVEINYDATDSKIELSEEHVNAVNRRRRIVLQYDPFHDLGIDFKKWVTGHFEPVDQPDSQIDAIWFDIGGANMAPYPSRVGDRYEHPGLRKWWDQGIDWIEELVRETRERNLEVFWNHRVAEVDREENPLKKANPDWVIKSWYYPGLWNLAVPDVRIHKVEFIQELIEKYEFDGIQLDFARHVPILPVGRQWELRDNVTEFVRMVRLMMLEMEKKHGRPLLLAAKVPKNLEGCLVDGFDVETWARQNLVDIFILGTRSMDVDIAAYRRITTGRNIKLIPCWDDYHSTDAYKSPSMETYRGIFGNWLQQGADGIMIFNWVANEFYSDISKYDRDRLIAMVSEGGSPETLHLKDKTFVVERRGGYPWGEGYFGLNNTSPLPVTLANDGRPAVLQIRIGDNLRAYNDKINKVTLRAVIFGANEGDEIGIRFNGITSLPVLQDYSWKDPQLFAPLPATDGINVYCYTRKLTAISRQLYSSTDDLPVDPGQKLLRMEFNIKPEMCNIGKNQVEIYIINRVPHSHGFGLHSIALEKLELHIDYK